MTPSLAGFMRKTNQGDIIMAALTDSDEGVVVVTTPAKCVYTQGHATGANTGPTRSRVSVNYLDDPSNRRYSGSINGTYTYVGTLPSNCTGWNIYKRSCSA